MYEIIKTRINEATRIVVIQAENPDGDSLGSSLALEDLLGNLGKQVSMYCNVSMPKYLRYINGWDRVSDEWTGDYDLAIIVDTSADTLLSKLLEVPGARHFLETHPVLVFDHHVGVTPTLSFPFEMIMSETAVATGELITDIASELGWKLTKPAADVLYSSIMSDSLGLTTEATTPQSYRAVATLLDAGTKPSELEAKRREMMKKSPEILSYKGKLIERIEYYCDGQLALVHIPWEDIQAYSDQYNPSVLVLDEMRLVENVQVAIAIKTYPDGKVTGKLRSNLPISDEIAGYFGGGGHPYASGFRTFETYDTVIKELLIAADKALREHASPS
jgi:bifunctional oligoribonuclease and PAP phosphatase NrnA